MIVKNRLEDLLKRWLKWQREGRVDTVGEWIDQTSAEMHYSKSTIKRYHLFFRMCVRLGCMSIEDK